MKAPRLGSGVALLAIAIAFFIFPAISHADSYQIFHLLSGRVFFSSYYVSGIQASGAVIVESHPGNGCPAPFPCFTTLVHGVQVGTGTPIDPGHYDNGTACAPRVSPLPAGATYAFGTCNNGYEVDEIDGLPNSRTPLPYAQIFTGPDPVADFFSLGSVLFLNSSGDFVYQVGGPKVGDPFDDYEAIDLTSDAPEPASLFLLGTGLLAGLGTMRRRFF